MPITHDPRLRPYQLDACNALAEYISTKDGNPCLVMPTGSGKSWIIADMCRSVLAEKADARILVLSHVKELLQQDADKIRAVWPEAPLGLYSAGLGQKDIQQITVAGIQSIHRHADECGAVDFVIVDECHLINTDGFGMYRKLLKELTEVNPALRVVGLTATPYRLGHGLITEGKNALFDSLLEPPSCSIEALVGNGYLTPLRSKFPGYEVDTCNVHQRGGEYIESELQEAVDTEKNNREIVAITKRLAQGRKALLVFCVGVAHAENMCSELRRQGIPAECVTGDTPKDERARILDDFKAGKLRALTNANVLTTGFDYPALDCLIFARPTMSVALYVQMAGRGMRVADGKKDCLVLDFAGNVEKHGPITDPNVMAISIKKQFKGGKKCPKCHELVAASAYVCPECGHVFEQRPPASPKPVEMVLHSDADIMGKENSSVPLRGWNWSVTTSRTTGTPMIKITYFPENLLDTRNLCEYICILHGGYAAQKAHETLCQFRSKYLVEDPWTSLEEICDSMNNEPAPLSIVVRRQRANPKYMEICSREWPEF